MLNTKLERIKDLIQQKEKIDAELSQLLGEAEKPKRGRPISRWSQSSATSSHLCNPTKLRNGLGTKFKAIFMGAPHKDPDDPIWAHPFRFQIEDQSCLVTVRNFVIFLPLSRDPRDPIVRHLKIVPQRYAFRPNFETRFT